VVSRWLEGDCAAPAKKLIERPLESSPLNRISGRIQATNDLLAFAYLSNKQVVLVTSSSGSPYATRKLSPAALGLDLVNAIEIVPGRNGYKIVASGIKVEGREFASSVKVLSLQAVLN
jgi:hypothetical protein